MQQKVVDFMRECPQVMSIESCMNDIVSEVGELAKEVNIATRWGREDVHAFRGNYATELGQVAFALMQLANITGVNVQNELDDVIDNFRARYKRQGHTGSSDYLDLDHG